MQQQRTQQETADAAGINRSTLLLLENGRGGTMMSLLQVLRVLQQLHVFKVFEVEKQVSPLLLAKLEQQQRKRVRKRDSKKEDDTNLNW